MRLSDILKPENVKIPLAATEKQAAIEELIDLLAANGDIRNADRVRTAVLEREATRSTGIGDGLAIPHGKSDGVDRLVIAVGRAADPIDFESIDGRPVTIIWLLCSPPDKTGPHITGLARISKIMARPDVRKAIASAGTPRHVYDIILSADAEI